jgi:hypothetical protein
MAASNKDLIEQCKREIENLKDKIIEMRGDPEDATQPCMLLMYFVYCACSFCVCPPF